VSGQTASKAALKEVKKEKHVYTFKGERFEFPPSRDDLPARSIREFERGRSINGIYALLGSDEERFDALNPTVKDMENFSNWFGKAYGFENAGESQASSGS